PLPPWAPPAPGPLCSIVGERSLLGGPSLLQVGRERRQQLDGAPLRRLAVLVEPERGRAQVGGAGGGVAAQTRGDLGLGADDGDVGRARSLAAASKDALVRRDVEIGREDL